MSVTVTSTRRRFVRRIFQAGAVMASGGGGAFSYGNQIERHHPVVEKVTLPLRGLGSAWNGCRIVQISDLHMEPIVDQELLRTTVSIINGLKPDVIVLTGDYVTSNSTKVATLAEPLVELKAPGGVYGCLGNHDMFSGRSRITRALQEHKITCLINSGRGLTKQGETLWVAGLDSAWGGSPDIAHALSGSPKNKGTVVLMHEPDNVDNLKHVPVPFLQLSGHTHGGQCCLPGGVPVHLPKWGRNYAKGRFDLGRVQLYVNRGIGCIGVPVRFACPPEITEITLACV